MKVLFGLLSLVALATACNKSESGGGGALIALLFSKPGVPVTENRIEITGAGGTSLSIQPGSINIYSSSLGLPGEVPRSIRSLDTSSDAAIDGNVVVQLNENSGVTIDMPAMDPNATTVQFPAPTASADGANTLQLNLGNSVYAVAEECSGTGSFDENTGDFTASVEACKLNRVAGPADSDSSISVTASLNTALPLSGDAQPSAQSIRGKPVSSNPFRAMKGTPIVLCYNVDDSRTPNGCTADQPFPQPTLCATLVKYHNTCTPSVTATRCEGWHSCAVY